MRFLVDAQLPPALCGGFEERGFEAEHVSQRLAGQTPDSEIALFAAAEGFVLVAKDDDFALRYPPIDYRLVWLRCGNITNRRCGNGSSSAGPCCSSSWTPERI